MRKPVDVEEHEDLINSKTFAHDYFPGNEVGSYERGTAPQSTSSTNEKAENTNSKSDSHADQDFASTGDIHYELKLHNEDPNGVYVTMQKCEMALDCSIPPKSGGKVFASFHGNSSFLKLKGFAQSKLSLGYNANKQTQLFYNFHSIGGLLQKSYGLNFNREKSNTKIDYLFPTTKEITTEPEYLTIQNSINITDKVKLETEMQIGALPSDIAMSKFKVGVSTTHDQPMLPHVQIYIDFFRKTFLNIGYQSYLDTQKKFSTELFLGWSVRNLEIKALVTRAIDKFTHLGIGIGHTSWQGLTWIFKLQKEELSLNIPVQISTPEIVGHSFYNSVLYSLSTLYFGMLSSVIHMAIDEVIPNVKVSDDIKREETRLSVQKARSDAENQISLMARKAKSIKRSEESKNGLVIQNATYYIEGGDTFNVTIPLQFWVSDSRLHLSASSFGSMLGFYELRASKAAVSSDVSAGSKRNVFNGLADLWNFLQVEEKDSEKVPILWVQYKLNEKVFEISVLDHEALQLPHPCAKEIINT
ncbi:hypothetical protein CTEN210_04534 [Chaetoceros tenuissimus]|uniref:DnaJ-like protein C11 C-terminal domain-containing protein n=1 Tax=Chaetoceros tenuissimus TaxID=426638 RepID=A0AAD3CM12_9STRA|nr:hypothetical protein CTEN210_04534 [Chaetoceros tenuissimus]